MTYEAYSSARMDLTTKINDLRFGAGMHEKRVAKYLELGRYASDAKQKIHSEWRERMDELNKERFDFTKPATEELVIARKLAYNNHWKDIMDAQINLDKDLFIAEWEEANRICAQAQIDVLEKELEELETEWQKHKEAHEKAQWEKYQEEARKQQEQQEQQKENYTTTTSTTPNPETKKLHRQIIVQFHPDKFVGHANYKQIENIIKQVNANSNNDMLLKQFQAELSELVA